MNKSDIIPSVEVKTDYNSWHGNSSEELPYQQPCNSFLPESKNSMWRTQTHTHTYVSRAMAIMFKYLCASRRKRGSGTDACKPRSQPLKYSPEANALSQPNSTIPAHLEARFSGDCSGNRLFRAYGSRRALSLAGWAGLSL